MGSENLTGQVPGEEGSLPEEGASAAPVSPVGPWPGVGAEGSWRPGWLPKPAPVPAPLGGILGLPTTAAPTFLLT